MTDGPGFWLDETSGVLAPAVKAYLETNAPLSPEHVAILRAYFRQWIMAPVWDRNPYTGGRDLVGLRATIDGLTNRAAFDDWLAEAVALAVDPL